MRVQMKSVLLLLFLFIFFTPTGQPTLAGPLPAPCYRMFSPVLVAPAGSAAGVGEKGDASVLAPPCSVGKDMVDFNGDGYEDLAIGNPGDTSVVIDNAGSVAILYGTASGLSAANNELWTQGSLGLGAASGENFGYSVSAADFDGDGYTDLAIGAPDERVSGVPEAGRVVILYGSASGLTNRGFQEFSQANPDITGVAEEGDRFGATLASGDFNGDSFADLAIGVPDEGLEAQGIDQAGAVNVLYGTPDGLTTEGNLILHQGLSTVSGTPGDQALFGTALVAADFDNDGDDELAVGIPGYSLVGIDHAGAVEVFQGSENGLSLLDETLWRQGANSVQGNPEPSDWFGASLAAGDFDRNGAADLAIGVPFEDVAQGGSDVVNSGAFHVLYGSAIAGGLSGANDQIWHRALGDVFGAAGTLDLFGYALVAADFNYDGADDLAVGVPGYSGDSAQQGMVQIFYSNGSILSGANQGLLLQGLIQGVPDFQDFFGWSLGAGDFDSDGYDDLAVGVPYEDSDNNTVADSGAVNVIYGSGSGISVPGNQIWHQDSTGSMLGTQEAGDRFGFALSR